MTHHTHRAQRVATLLLVPVLALLTGGPLTAGTVLVRSTRAPRVTPGTPDVIDPFAPVVAGVGLIAWLGTGWLALVLVLDLGTRLPGTVGRVSARALPRVAPESLRLLVRGATGLLLAGAVLGGSPALAATEPRPAPLAAEALDWPIATTAPDVPTAPPPTAPGVPTAPPPAEPHRPTRAPAYVVVPGDSLWAIASRDLSHQATAPSAAQVAANWPRWWQANRAVIGSDPDLLLPGTPLLPPTAP